MFHLLSIGWLLILYGVGEKEMVSSCIQNACFHVCSKEGSTHHFRALAYLTEYRRIPRCILHLSLVEEVVMERKSAHRTNSECALGSENESSKTESIK